MFVVGVFFFNFPSFSLARSHETFSLTLSLEKSLSRLHARVFLSLSSLLSLARFVVSITTAMVHEIKIYTQNIYYISSGKEHFLHKVCFSRATNRLSVQLPHKKRNFHRNEGGGKTEEGSHEKFTTSTHEKCLALN